MLDLSRRLRMDGSSSDAKFLEVAALSKRYGEQLALRDVAFSTRSGEVLGIVGPNGAGKTTLLEAIAGLLPVDGGAVCLNGRALAAAQRHNAIFYLPDGVRPYPDQFVMQVLGFFAGVYRSSSAQLATVVERLGLTPVLHKRVHALSKGYARRLILALGLLTPQPLLLMDEPFDGFDLRQTRDVMALLRAAAASGRTLILAIHQLTDAERMCDRLLFLREGCVLALGTLDELRARTALPAASLEELFVALT
jgi:ABC-type multidrug transport system ATPase subunit